MTSALVSDVTEYVWRVKQGAKDGLTIPILRAGDPYPIDGWTVDAKVKTRPGAAGLLLYAWPAELITVTGAQVELTLPGPVSSAWAWCSGWYRVKVTDPATASDPNPDTSRVLQGPIYLDLD